ncbi:MAG TPA: 16S rRNA (cytosine(1402)-N(4))-methyltransferase RsmH [Acidimicrobiia bacterium]|nr:16S rRNA (cytosine(1402)-N(4))-methyltransferase RsmH [Acidimicrobiia bacterium]
MSQDRSGNGRYYHRPVLVDEVVGLLAPVLPGVVVDATFGGGGHARRLLDEFGEDVTLIGIDRDPDAVANARELGLVAIQGNFSEMSALVSSIIPTPVSAVLFDFGVSSHQLDDPSRGFSYRNDGPLDMRMGPDAAYRADEIVNEWPEDRLTDVIRRFGEESQPRRVARAIIAARPIQSTSQLSTVIAEALPAARRRAGHPARRTFQAIRIAVNDELEAVQRGLDQALEIIRPGGRVVAISYHSLEDRIVKRRFARGATGCTCPPEMPVCGCGNTAELRILTRKAIRANPAEIAENNRARSAVLRAVEKVAA